MPGHGTPRPPPCPSDGNDWKTSHRPDLAVLRSGRRARPCPCSLAASDDDPLPGPGLRGERDPPVRRCASIRLGHGFSSAHGELARPATAAFGSRDSRSRIVPVSVSLSFVTCGQRGAPAMGAARPYTSRSVPKWMSRVRPHPVDEKPLDLRLGRSEPVGSVTDDGSTDGGVNPPPGQGIVRASDLAVGPVSCAVRFPLDPFGSTCAPRARDPRRRSHRGDLS